MKLNAKAVMNVSAPITIRAPPFVMPPRAVPSWRSCGSSRREALPLRHVPQVVVEAHDGGVREAQCQVQRRRLGVDREDRLGWGRLQLEAIRRAGAPDLVRALLATDLRKGSAGRR